MDSDVCERFLNSRISLTVSARTNLYEVVTTLVEHASDPIPIDALPSELKAKIQSRGRVLFGYVGNLIDEIAYNLPDMYWWISEKGLNMAIISRKQMEAMVHEEMLSDFDRLAGKLCVDYWKDGLSKDDLKLIAKELDANAPQGKGVFLDRFEPKPRKAIAVHNQRNRKATVKTFQQAVGNPKFVTLIRRMLYRKRDKYLKVQELIRSASMVANGQVPLPKLKPNK